MATLSGLTIREPWIDMILEGKKTWEIRSMFTKKNGLVALIRSGSGTVVGTAKVSKVIELTASIAKKNARLMGDKKLSDDEAFDLDGYYAWVLEDVIAFKKPVPFVRPRGPITWVILDEPTTKKVKAESARSRRRKPI
jgi:hypothetical protein